jgi:hypothetical protein
LEVERLIGDESLDLAIVLLEGAEPFRVTTLQAAVFPLPAVERLLHHAVPANEIRDLCSGIPLLQPGDDLLVRKSTSFHSPLG